MDIYKKYLLLALAPALVACGGTNNTASNNTTDAPKAAVETTKTEAAPTLKVSSVTTPLVETISGDTDRFAMMWTALRSAQMRSSLGGEGNKFTVFAPTGAAFGAVPNLQEIMTDTPQIASVLGAHVLEYEYHPDSFRTESVATKGGKTLNLQVAADGFMVEDAKVLEAIETPNGVIYMIDKVLFTGAKKN